MVITIVSDIYGNGNKPITALIDDVIDYFELNGHKVIFVCPDTVDCSRFCLSPTISLEEYVDFFISNGNVRNPEFDDTVLRDTIISSDVIHVMTPFFLSHKAVALAKEYNKPVSGSFLCFADSIINNLHMSNRRLASHLIYKAFWNYVYKDCDAIHYTSEYVKKLFESNIKVKTCSYVISSGVAKLFHPFGIPKPSIFKNKFIIAFTGLDADFKSHKTVIDAVMRNKYAKEIQILFTGSNPYEEDITEYCRKINFTGFAFGHFQHEELFRVMNYSDILVYPAKSELEAITCIEAFSCGIVPIIANSSLTPAKVLAISNVNLYKNNDSDDLSSKITYWFTNRDEIDAYGQRYIELSKQYSKSVCLERFANMIITNYDKHQST